MGFFYSGREGPRFLLTKLPTVVVPDYEYFSHTGFSHPAIKVFGTVCLVRMSFVWSVLAGLPLCYYYYMFNVRMC